MYLRFKMCLLILRKIAVDGCPMKVETGSLIFAAVNCLSLCVASFISLFLIIGYEFDWDFNLEGYLRSIGIDEDLTLASLLILLTFTLLALGFSFILNTGLLKRNALWVKIYFTFGVLVTVVSLCLVISFAKFPGFSLYYQDIKHLIIVTSLIVLCIYALFLSMIKETYEKFEEEAADAEDERRIFVVSRAVKRIHKQQDSMLVGLLGPEDSWKTEKGTPYVSFRL